MFNWVDAIGELYHQNKLRVALWDKDQPLDAQSAAFNEQQPELIDRLSAMQQRYQACLQEADLHKVQQKVLSSLKNHWQGLTLFAEHPEIAMDNNLCYAACGIA